MNSKKLDKRLSLIASLVRSGSRMVDVGTDHAHLPVWLVNNGVCPLAIATDIRPAPADKAAQNILAAELGDSIDVRLGDGLSTVNPMEVDDIVIAGMGGETIAEIIKASPWTKDGRYRLILQPMTKPAALHEFLFYNGYTIIKEQTVEDGNRGYLVMAARYDPPAATKQLQHPASIIRGALDINHNLKYLEKQRKRLMNEAGALKRAGHEDKAEKLERLAEELFKSDTVLK
ncbi:MAG: class I SAM-dependent methyltransferase [Oscillospiraceae bacterium]|nr:class I SAM-dependent methyltransferase [Oscillospiraceae bacterium]MDD3832946.1 class I SAM-dependent methyltransferase [Oscillospiraceae bacterium]MDD4545946.1 class I SAM-dependent methyltransferase [Oscillospiraceae bacterium]